MIARLVCVALLASACGADDEPTDACTDAPVVSYATFGAGFLDTQCQGCHASTAIDRHGAPDDVIFDTAADAERFGPRILARAGGTAPDMPPAGGASDDDRERLRLWVTCFGTR